MTKTEFLNYVNNIYKSYQFSDYMLIDILRKKDKTKYNHFIEFLKENIDNAIDCYIHIKKFDIKNNRILIYTDIGTFCLKTPRDSLYDSNIIEKHNNHDIEFLKFFNSMYSGSINFNSSYQYKDDDSLAIFFINAFYNYKYLTDKEKVNDFFKHFKNRDSKMIVSLETLDNKDYNSGFCFGYKDIYHKILSEYRDIYDNVYQFNNNKKLIYYFSIILNDFSKIDFIKQDLQTFKDFIMNEDKSYYMNYRKEIYKFLIESKLIKNFNDEDLLQMYKKNTYYLIIDEANIFSHVITKIKNDSPEIYLDDTKKEKIHIYYHNYDLYDGIPFDCYLINDLKNVKPTYKRLVFANIEVINKLYYMYYKKYQSNIKQEGNLYHFIEYLLQKKNMKIIYNSYNLTSNDVYLLEQFIPYYDKSVGEEIETLKLNFRKSNLRFYNGIVNLRDDKEQLESLLIKFGIDPSNSCSFVINNKFFQTKEKEALITILYKHYKEYFNIADILMILDDAKNRNIDVYKAAKDQSISKKLFDKLYNNEQVDNPILYEHTFLNMQSRQRKALINLVRYGNKIVRSDVSSIQDFNERFAKGLSYYDIVRKLSITNLGPRLLEKAKQFPDFCEELVKQKVKKNVKK